MITILFMVLLLAGQLFVTRVASPVRWPVLVQCHENELVLIPLDYFSGFL